MYQKLLALAVCFWLSPTSVQILEVCDYLRMIGRTSSDCSDHNKSDNSTISPLASIISSIEKDEHRRMVSLNKIQQRPGKAFSFGTCTGPEYNDCRYEKGCFSKYSCLRAETGTRCCLKSSMNHLKPKQVLQCPSTVEMGYVCMPWRSKLKTTSWCLSNDDCARTSPQLCCDTGCGFNVCLQMNGFIVDNAIRFITSDDCPDPNSMQIKCSSSYRRHTNWCNFDHECETGRFHRVESPTVRRLCCPTPCGYNTCINLASGIYRIGK